MILERSVEQRVRNWCRQHALACLKLQGPKGFPDRTILGPDGFICFLELKQTRGRLSEAQIVWQTVLQQYGFPCSVAYSADEAFEFIQGAMNERA